MADEPRALAEQLLAGLNAALLRRDRAAVEAQLAPGFRLDGVRAKGVIAIDRPGWFDALGRLQLSALTGRVEHVVADAGVLVVTARCCWVTEIIGQPVAEHVLTSDCWVRSGGGWRLLHRHSSLLPGGA